ncbi:MAG: hypothetical protein Q4F60_00255 [Candidatus Saccharibacteria bacterium]|nr:hypothetical protein [Candidatus Saccharibacteria bacterium]
MKYFQNLYKSHRHLLLIEWFYGIFSAVALVLASLIGLLNASVGAALLIIPLISFTALSMNLVCWALIKLFADHLSSQNQKATKEPLKKTTKKSTTTKKSA